MLKRMIALCLVIAMLVPLSSAVAADATSAPPTVEEILSEYHRKAFEAQTQTESNTASTWSRRGTEKTLEQETVDTLTEAGYEAYNVTADNYDTLEAELQTDFASMGLNPEGSYIIVVHGEEPTATNSNARTGGDDIVIDDGGLGGQGYIAYTYNGTTYRMRYLTITSADEVTRLSDGGIYPLDPTPWIQRLAVSFWDALFIAATDDLSSAFNKKVKLGTVLSTLISWQIDENYTRLQPGTLTLHSCTDWSISALQIWNEVESKWQTAQVSASAHSRLRSVGYVFDPAVCSSSWYEGVEQSNTQHSENYYNFSQRQLDAAIAFELGGDPSYDKTGNIDFYLAEPSGEIVFDEQGNPLFTHYEGWMLCD